MDGDILWNKGDECKGILREFADLALIGGVFG